MTTAVSKVLSCRPQQFLGIVGRVARRERGITPLLPLRQVEAEHSQGIDVQSHLVSKSPCPFNIRRYDIAGQQNKTGCEG